MHPSFDDRTVTLDAPEQLSLLGAVLGSRTRLQVLRTLVSAGQPLHINEIARRVGVDASPVRTHLELLVKAGLAREVGLDVGRERRFETVLQGVKVTLEGAERAAAPEKGREKPKDVAKLEKKLAELAKDESKLAEKARRIRDEIREAWAEADAETEDSNKKG
jgi:DNA-binding transcriptional ArsR family regulator